MFGGFFSKQKEQPQEPVKKQLTKEEMKEQQRALKKTLHHQQRELDREIFKIDNMRKESEKKLEKEVKKGTQADKFIKNTYAKQMVQATNRKNQYLSSKAKIQGLEYSIDNFYAQLKMTQVMQSSTDIMKQVAQIANIKEMNQTAQEMQKEMMKMGLITEMVDEVMESMNDDVDLGENEAEVDNIITQMELQHQEKEKQKPQVMQQQNQVQQNNDLDDFSQRLANLS